MSQPKILLTGATGYIGGSVLTHLLEADPATPRSITCLVRGKARVAELEKIYGDRVKPELFQSLDNIDRIVEVASEHDVVINTTLGYHPESAAALVKGLAARRQSTGRDTYMIHTSGTSNLGDRCITGARVESRTFDDARDYVYSYEKELNAKEPYGQRTSELGVIDAGLETGVKTIVIMSPTIYGVGSGYWNQHSIQVPTYVNATLREGQAVVIGEGSGIWDNVHIQDLTKLYRIVLLDILQHEGKDLPFGKEGIIFSGNGRHTWKELAQGVANAAFEAGAIKSRDVRSVSLETGANIMTGGDQQIVELGMSSNSRTQSTVARQLGWSPTQGIEAFRRGFVEEVEHAAKKVAA